MIDQGNAQVGFVGRHFGLTRIRERFTGVKGSVIVAEDMVRSSVSIDIYVASVNSGDRAHDHHFRPNDDFDFAVRQVD